MVEHKSKISQSADCIHSTIAQSTVEKAVIATTLFNRLHNILQNSTLFLTYPCNRTSRFSHSLGCMHIAGELFRNSITNASQKDLTWFISAMRNDLDRIVNSESFTSAAFAIVKHKDKINWSTPKGLNDHLYLSSIPNISWLQNEKADEFRFLYLLAFQGVRLTALLHDLGHPPFSHVTEDALVDLAEKIKGSPDKEAKALVSLIETKAEDDLDLGLQKLHENIGEKLIEGLLDELFHDGLNDLANVEDRDFKKHEDEFRRVRFVAVLRWFVSGILNEESPLLKALHLIIDGELDADRLDYVVRDLVSSGIYKDSIQYGRLFSAYRFWVGKEKEKDLPVFLPTTRVISTVEDFFWQRMFLYRYVVFHHRVAKMDGLLREALVELGSCYFNKSSPFDKPGNNSTEAGSGNLLSMHITSLWKVLVENRGYATLKQQFSQWDDSLLIGILRRHYFEQNPDDPNDPNALPFPLDIQLDELLSNRKSYLSLVKRPDDFLEIEESFMKAVAEGDSDIFKKERLAVTGEKGKTFAKALTRLAKFAKRYTLEEGKGGRRAMLQNEGLFLNRLCSALHNAGLDDTEFLVQASQAIQEQYIKADAEKRIHIFIVRKRLKAGVTQTLPFLFDDGSGAEIEFFGSISPVVGELIRTASVFPPFFVYVHFGGKSISPPLSEIRKNLGIALYTHYKRLYVNDNTKSRGGDTELNASTAQ